jgi:predicted ATP-binding protein involved in virulence
MQRSILGRLVDAFPKAQFVVVTHSPFVVSSVRDSSVYALKYTEWGENVSSEFSGNQVSSIKLDLDAKAATASEILRDVLGVPVTLPEWAESELKHITEEFCRKPISEKSFRDLREALNNAGLNEYLPDALKLIAG